SQLAAAVQVVVHVSRDRKGTRRLNEIGLLRPGEDGRVRVATAWHADTGFGCGHEHLATLLRNRVLP
ncbi:MAG: pilus assembly protein CpaF, partial [Mycobacterium sp.]|nr:pilus assembly protein CpaF [Mycobacterium sp.]